MDIFDNLMNNLGEVNLSGQNLADVGKKILVHISDDAYVDAVYEWCRYFRDMDEESAKEETVLKRAKWYQDRADKLSRLIQNEKKYKENVKKVLTYLENLYLTCYKNSIAEEITSFLIEDGKVQMSNESVGHTTHLSQMDGISRGGLLASEWFGELEYEYEGRFCCFLSKVDQINKNNELLSIGTAHLYFDTDSSIAKLLFGMDFFAYEKFKAINPDDVKKMFSPEVIELFETVIEPLSPGYYISKSHPSWMAIPGGIPSQLIKGIMLSSKEDKLDELAEYSSNLFPKAIIFDNNYTVLRMPKSISEPGNKTMG